MTPASPTVPFLTRDCAMFGVSRRRLNSTEFRGVLPGVAVAAMVPDTVVVRARAAMLLAPEGAVISHWTAARLWGGVVPDNEWTHVAFMRDVRFRVLGVKPHRFRHRLEIRHRHGLPVTSPLQTFCHLARHLGLVDLVALGDRLVRKGRFTPDELRTYCRAWPGQCREAAATAADLVRERVDSTPETAVRLLMVLAGLPEPQIDIRIRDENGQIVFRLDLGFAELRLAIEYDGRWHDTPEQRELDRGRREHLAVADGWRFEVVTATDLYEHPDDLVLRLRDVILELGGSCPEPSSAWRRHFRVAAVAS